MISASLPQAVYQTEQLRRGEAQAAEAVGLTLDQLMEAAGAALWELLEQRWQHELAEHGLVVVLGPGNNGGDGYVVARLAAAAGIRVQLFASPPKTELAQQKAEALTACLLTKNRQQQPQTEALPLAELARHGVRDAVVVDALLGNGISRPVQGDFKTVIEQLNDWQGPVVSADIPSGLQSDSGQPQPIAVTATVTVTFIAVKQGLVTGRAADFCGELLFADLGVAESFAAQNSPAAMRICATQANSWLTPRSPATHKGQQGTVLIIGGGRGMAGAAALAGMAALRAGAGKVLVACHPASYQTIAMQQPELMVHPIETAADLAPLLKLATQIAIGPGLGTDNWAQQLWQAVLQSDCPMVVDADALRLLAQAPQAYAPGWILTPHPGEAGSLLEQSTAEISANRWQAVAQLSQRYVQQGGDENAATSAVLLKGAGTLIADGSGVWVNTTGSAAMASGGMGDVLTGLLSGLWAQLPQLTATEVTCLAVWLHGRAAELAAQDGVRGTLASDLLVPIRQLVNGHQ